MDKKEIGKQLRDRRKKVSGIDRMVLDIQKLNETDPTYTRLTKATIINIERGRSNYTIDSLLTYLKYIGVTQKSFLSFLE